MNLGNLRTNFVIGITSFLFSFAFLNSILLKYNRIPISIIVHGDNLKNLKANYNNKFTRKTPLQISDSSILKYTFEVQEYDYIRNLNLTLDYNSSIRINKIELRGNGNMTTIKSNKIPDYFRYHNYRYDPESQIFVQDNSLKNIKNQKISLTSFDISKIINDLYIKRITIYSCILYSIIFAILSLAVYYFFIFKNQIALKKIVVLILFIVPISTFAYKIIDSKSINKENFNEVCIFDIIKPHTTNNLVYNGDFKYGLLFWGYDSDSTTHKLIDTPFGKGVKITRGNGDGGYWSLRYYGKPILYNKNSTYIIKFKYKVLKETTTPFNIGWWIPSGEIGHGKSHTLKIVSKKINNDWFQAEACYTFLSDYSNLVCILNCLKDNSEVEITDVGIYLKDDE